MCAPLVLLLGMTGAAIVLFLLLVVGFLLFFNMTIGDVFTAWSRRQTEVGPATAAAAASAGASTKPGVSPSTADRSREPPPLILRRQRAEPAPMAAGATAASGVAVPIVSPPPATEEEIESIEEAHLAEVGEREAVDAALEAAGPGLGPART